MFKYTLVIALLILSQLNSLGQNDSIWFDTGVQYYTHLKFEKAIYSFSVSIEKGYRVAMSYAYKSAAEMASGKLTDAEADLDVAMKIDSVDYNMFYLKGRLYSLKEEYDSSIVWFRKALLGDSSRPEFNDELAMSYNYTNHFDLALKYEENAIKITPRNNVFIGNRALIKQGMGKYEDAINDLELALKLSPGDYTYMTNFALCKYKLKKYTEALSICDSVITQHPDFGFVYLVRGQIKYSIGQKTSACEDLKHLLLSWDYKKTAPGYLKQYGCPVNP